MLHSGLLVPYKCLQESQQNQLPRFTATAATDEHVTIPNRRWSRAPFIGEMYQETD